MRRVLTLPLVVASIALLLAVSGVAVGGVAANGVALDSGPTGTGDAAYSTTADECEVGDGTELVGCWNGVHYAEDPGFNQSDGLTEDELERLTHLSMARVEHLRERPFRADVPVETVTRSEFADERAGGSDDDEAFQRWNDQVWKALFVVGEDDASGDAIDAVFGGAVSGFYSPADQRVVLVVDEDETLQVSELTLVHEVAHAMQDQYHDLGNPRYVGDTQDADLAVDGIVEGEVVYLEERYDERCEANWTCLDEPDAGDGAGELPENFNFGILQTVLQPYSDGVPYVAELVDEDGWDAVNATMNDPPETTSEVIHRTPEYETREVEFEDTATGGWETYDDQGIDGAETAGEASMFVMFWYQSFEYDHPVLDPDASVAENVRIHTQPDTELRTRAAYNYAHEATDGWAGDELYPYWNDGDGDDARDGYVWVTEWQTPDDAAQFHETYLRMLTAHGDDEYEPGEVYAVNDGDFRGAYGVERENTTVTIAHAPEPSDVLELRPDADLSVPATDDEENGDETDATDGPTDGPTDGGTDADETDADDATDPADTSGEAPGFGVAAALVGLLAAVALLVRRSRS